MDERVNKVTALANAVFYGSQSTLKYIDGAPHIKHFKLRKLYGELVVTIYDYAKKYADPPKILDLGAGEGSATLPFLELGAEVTAVDISESSLRLLKTKCSTSVRELEIRGQDVFDAIKSLQSEGRQYDVIVANSFLHHVPDYLGLIREAVSILSPNGQFFSFQDPLRYDSVGRFSRIFSALAYFAWRISKGDIRGGLKRRIRRSRKIYLDEEDNVEYHVVRGGIDQNAIIELSNQLGLKCEIFRYFSTQSPVWQRSGTALGIKNTFAIIGKRATLMNHPEFSASANPLANATIVRTG